MNKQQKSKHLKLIFVVISMISIIALIGCTVNTSADSATTKPHTDISSSSLTEDTNFTNTSQSKSTNTETGKPIVESSSQIGNEAASSVDIKIGNTNFVAILYDNASTQALLAQMPLTLNMDDLHKNEKYYYLSESIPTDSAQVGTINSGDLMLYGSDCVVLFYKNFPTSYSYTKLGYIKDISGLADALGEGSAQVTFSVNDQ